MQTVTFSVSELELYQLGDVKAIMSQKSLSSEVITKALAIVLIIEFRMVSRVDVPNSILDLMWTIGHLYLGGMWIGVVPRAHIKKT